MKRKQVRYAPQADDDLGSIYDVIAEASSPSRALEYIERLEAFCGRLEYGAERGSMRDDIRAGLRVVGFERRVTVAFAVGDDTVTILRFFYGGRDWESTFG